jgi:excisionase family DNA binding protein
MEDTLRTMTSEQPLALTVAEAAKVAGVSPRTIYRGISAGAIPTVTLVPGGRKFVPRRALEALLSGEPRPATR